MSITKKQYREFKQGYAKYDVSIFYDKSFNAEEVWKALLHEYRCVDCVLYGECKGARRDKVKYRICLDCVIGKFYSEGNGMYSLFDYNNDLERDREKANIRWNR
jgi:hypothetical protein